MNEQESKERALVKPTRSTCKYTGLQKHCVQSADMRFGAAGVYSRPGFGVATVGSASSGEPEHTKPQRILIGGCRGAKPATSVGQRAYAAAAHNNGAGNARSLRASTTRGRGELARSAKREGGALAKGAHRWLAGGPARTESHANCTRWSQKQQPVGQHGRRTGDPHPQWTAYVNARIHEYAAHKRSQTVDTQRMTQER